MVLHGPSPATAIKSCSSHQSCGTQVLQRLAWSPAMASVKSCNNASGPATTHQVLQQCIKSCKDASSPATVHQVLHADHQVLQERIRISLNNPSAGLKVSPVTTQVLPWRIRSLLSFASSFPPLLSLSHFWLTQAGGTSYLLRAQVIRLCLSG